MRRLLVVLCLSLLWIPCALAQTTVISGPRQVLGGINYAGTAVRTPGTPDVYALIFDPVITVMPTGACFSFLADSANDGAVSITVSGQAAVPLVKRIGGVSRPLITGDLGIGQFVTACYDGAVAQIQTAGERPDIFVGTTAATVDPDCNVYDQYTFTALAENLTLNIPGNGAANCTPADGQTLAFSFANSAQDVTHTLTWSGLETAGGYSEESTLLFPTSTMANKVLTLQVRYNAATTHWTIVAMTPTGALGSLTYCGASGGPDTYACTNVVAVTAYTAGDCYNVVATNGTTGTPTPTLNVDTLGAKTLKKRVGGVSANLVAGDIGAGQLFTACYDGTDFQVPSLGDSAAVAKLAGGGSQEITGTGVTPRRAAITLTDGVAAVPGPASADIVYQHAMVAGTGGDVHFNAPSGATTDGQRLIFELLSAQAQQVPVSWDADAYCWNGGIAQPTHTSGTNVSKVYDYWQFLRNPTAGAGGTPCWVLVAIASSTEALEPGTLIISEAGGSSAAYGAFSVPLGSMDLTGAINGSAGTPHLTYVQPSPPARQTLLNTRVRQEVATVTTTASLDPDCQLYEQYSISALAENITINIPGNGTANCTPTDGQYLVFLFRNATEVDTYTINWITSAGGYSDEHFIALPTSTLRNKVLAVQFRWSATTLMWGLIGSSPVGSALVNPMDAPGEMIYGGVAGAVTALSSGTGLLYNNGAGALAWQDAATVKVWLALNNVANTADAEKNVATAAALAANGLNCLGAGEFATGVTETGVAEGCAIPAGVPAGATDGQVQYKNGTAFGATSGLLADGGAVLKTTQKCIEVNSATTLWDTGISDCVWVDTTGGNVVVTIPAWASAVNARQAQIVKRSNDANTLTLRMTGNDTMNGDGTDRTTTDQWTGWSVRESSISDNWYVETFHDIVPVAAGGTGAAPGAGDQVLVSDSTTAGTWHALPADCSDASRALTYNTTTNLFGCNTISGSGTVNTGDYQHLAVYSTNPTGTVVDDVGNATLLAGALTLGTAGATPGTVALANNTSGVLTVTAPAGVALGTATLTLPNATDTLVGKATTDTLTNKTLDVEGTGNVITTVSKVWLPAATCQNTTAQLNWDTGTTEIPTAACVTNHGLADFADSGPFAMHTTLLLPDDWTGLVHAKILWLSATNTADAGVVWTVKTVCVADDDADTNTYGNTTSFAEDITKTTASELNATALTQITVTGCAAGELMHVQVRRDPANDDLSGTARFYGLELTLRRQQ